jgi:2-methylisocitrate lyase-like PEP mutase family enzyme
MLRRVYDRIMTSNDASKKTEQFHDMHFGPDVLVLPNAWDHLSAALFVAAGFPAIATTSAGVAYVHGHADGEHLGRDRMLEIVGRIAQQSAVPVTADLEAGYGAAPDDVALTVDGAIDAGLAGCNIEDSDPRTGSLFDFDRSVARIRAGRAAADRRNTKFVLNARADPFLRKFGDAEASFREAVRRANAYLSAGATSAFVPGPNDAETIGRLAREIEGPLNVLAGRAGARGLSVAEYRQLGVRRVSIGGSLTLATAAFIRQAASRIREGDFSYAVNAITNAEMNAFMGALKPIEAPSE